MSEAVLDFAVYGSSPLAGLVAGLLARQHGKKVVIVGDVQARYRLPRALDLSLAPITRPETWSLLTRTGPDIYKLIARIGGRGALRRVDPIFFADGQAAREALGHFAHMARAHGLILEIVPQSKLGASRAALRVSDALAINRAAFEPALEGWIAQAGVRRLAPQAGSVASDGTATLTSGEDIVRATRAVLVDDAAIAQHLPGWQWPAQLMRQPSATILTASNRHLAGPIMLQLDSGTVLVEHEEGGMAAIGPGSLSAFSARLAGLLAETGQLQQVGQVGFDLLVSSDGAPLLGQSTSEGPIMLTGLGPSGAFLAPVLARWLVGEASSEEAQWCEVRRADHRGLGRSVADFSGFLQEQAA